MNRKLEAVERPHFQLAIGDSRYLDPKYRVVSIGYTDFLTLTRTIDGNIAYAKSWCRFKHLCGTSSIYGTWCEQIKAYIIARLLDPGRLTESSVDSIILFARSLSPVKERIELIKSYYQLDYVQELIHHLKILVKDLANKRQTSNEGQKVRGIFVATLRNLHVSSTNLSSVSP